MDDSPKLDSNMIPQCGISKDTIFMNYAFDNETALISITDLFG